MEGRLQERLRAIAAEAAERNPEGYTSVVERRVQRGKATPGWDLSKEDVEELVPAEAGGRAGVTRTEAALSKGDVPWALRRAGWTFEGATWRSRRCCGLLLLRRSAWTPLRAPASP